MCKVSKGLFYGSWWLPDDPENKIRGTLTISEDGSAELVFDFFNHQCDMMLNREQNASIEIHGETPETLHSGDYRFYVLQGVEFRREQLKSNHIREYVTPSRVIVSGNATEAQSRLKTVKIFIEDFDFFFNVERSTIAVFGSNSNTFKQNFDLPEVQLRGKGDLSISLHYGSSFPSPDKLTSEFFGSGKSFDFRLQTPQAYVKIESLDGKTFGEWQKVIEGIRYFLCLIFGRPLYLKNIRFDSTNLFGTSLHFYSAVPNPALNHYTANRLLFRYSDIKENFGLLLFAFVDIYEKIKKSFDYFFYSFFDAKEFDERRFLFMSLALENFSKSCRAPSGKYSNERWGVILEKITVNLSSDERAFIRHKLEYANEASLRERFKDLFNLIEGQIDSSFNCGRYIHEFIDIRNKITHRMSSLDGDDERRMVRLTYQAFYLYILLVFHQCFSRAEVPNLPFKLDREIWLKWLLFRYKDY